MSSTDLSARAPLILLGIATIGWYAAANAAADALSGGRFSPGRRAIGYSIPVAIVALFGIVLNRPEVTVGVVFGSSVACLTLVMGIVTLTVDRSRQLRSRRVWTFLLPVTLIALLVGFSGSVGWTGVMVLAIEGVVLLAIWNDDLPIAKVADNLDVSESAENPNYVAHPKASDGWKRAQFAFAILAAVVASWAGARAARDISNTLELPGCGLVTALMIAPALVLPMIGSGSALAHEGRFDEAVSIQTGFVMLNLCAILPLAATLWLTRPYWQPPIRSVVMIVFTEPVAPTTAPATTSSTAPVNSDHVDASPKGLPYPMAVWRVDAVLLVALGLFLLPLALGRWSIAGAEGIALVFVYLMYMGLTTVMARG